MPVPETVQDKPAFKNAIKRRRCLVPADGYYEWQDAGGRKRPYFIYRHNGAARGSGFAAHRNLDGSRRGGQYRRARDRPGER